MMRWMNSDTKRKMWTFKAALSIAAAAALLVAISGRSAVAILFASGPVFEPFSFLLGAIVATAICWITRFPWSQLTEALRNICRRNAIFFVLALGCTGLLIYF